MPYSQRVKRIFHSRGISLGDRISIAKGDASYEGALMPRSEFGDLDCIVLKLENGYNVGIRYEHGTKIAKVQQPQKKSNDFKNKDRTKNDSQARSELPTISIIGTGGTILSRVDYKTGAVHALNTASEIVDAIPEIETIANIRTMQPMQIMSEDITPKLWVRIARLIAEEIRKGSTGVIVSHGTDTLHYTAAALAFLLPSLPVPIAVVGSQRSSDRPSSDSAMNLICATHFVSSSDIAESCVVMHEDSSDNYCLAHRGTKVRKMHTSARDAFRSINDSPLARIRYPDGHIEVINRNYRKRGAHKLVVDDRIEARVAMVKTYPGMDAGVMDYYIERGFRGIVIEATGLGHTPTLGASSLLPKLQRAREKGIAVVITSQCLYGRVNPNVYRNLREVSRRGAIFLEDMLPEVAYVKLIWALGHSSDLIEISSIMLTNVANEINPRTILNSE